MNYVMTPLVSLAHHVRGNFKDDVRHGRSLEGVDVELERQGAVENAPVGAHRQPADVLYVSAEARRIVEALCGTGCNKSGLLHGTVICRVVSGRARVGSG